MREILYFLSKFFLKCSMLTKGKMFKTHSLTYFAMVCDILDEKLFVHLLRDKNEKKTHRKKNHISNVASTF